MMLLAAAAGTAVIGVWLAVTDLPSQIFGISLATVAFSVLVYACNDLRRSVDRTREENAQLREAMSRLINSRTVDPQTREAVREVMARDVDVDGGTP